MTESVVHELVLISLNIGCNVVVWHYLWPDRKWVAALLFVVTIIAVLFLAERWHIDLTNV